MVARTDPRDRDRRGRRRQAGRDRALIDGAIRISYASLAARADALAAGSPTARAGPRRPDRRPAAELLAVRRAHPRLPARRDRAGHGAARAPRARARLPVRAQRGPGPGRVPTAARLRPRGRSRTAAGRLGHACGTSWSQARPGRHHGNADLTALRGARDAAARAGTLGRRPARRPRRRGVPALRRHDRAAEADRPHAQRLFLQRARFRRTVRPRRGHGLPGQPPGLAQLPAGLPRHPRHPAVRRPGGHARLAAAAERVRHDRGRRRHPSPPSSPPSPSAGWLTPTSTGQTRCARCGSCRSAAPGSPTNWPGGCGRSSARRSSRSSAWPKGC